MKKLLLLLLCVLMCIQAMPALAGKTIPSNEPVLRPEIEGAGEDGYMLSDADEFVLADNENGLWLYVSSTLRVEIDRYTATDRKEIWYVAHIYQKEPIGLSTYLSNENAPYDNYMWPYDIAIKYQCVFATSGDFFADRQGDSGPVGIVLRHGEIVARKTRADGGIPTRELIALLPGGEMKCFGATEHTATEYVEMGVTDTLCFGPILVKDGEVPLKRLTNMGSAREPRCAIGMVEPGHYVSIVCEGRTETSNGVRLSDLGLLMEEEGCTEALNLDGGQTAVMIFMGSQINVTGRNGTSIQPRKMTDIIGTGYSELVNAPE